VTIVVDLLGAGVATATAPRSVAAPGATPSANPPPAAGHE